MKSSLFEGFAAVFLALLGTQALAQSPSSLQPLPRCDAGSRSFYLMRYFNPTALGVPPKVTLDLTTIPASGATTRQQIWDGLGAPTVSPREIALGSAPLRPAGASVAGGMGKDGFIYAMRAYDGDNAWDNSPAAGWSSTQGGGWTSHTRHYEMLRYGRNGVENLGIVSGLGTYRTDPTNSASQVNGAVAYQLGPNFNAADINPVNGYFYVANFQNPPGGAALSKIHVIDVTQSPPVLVNTLSLSGAIPGTQSGDFAIDASGTYAYGVAYTNLGGLNRSSRSYKIDLNTGAVTTLGDPGAGPGFLPYGAVARLLDGTFVAYGTNSTYLLNTGTGALTDARTTATANSADATACLPKLTATLVCTPTELVDAPSNVSNCTVTLDGQAPAGGLEVMLKPLADNTRYTSDCGNSLTVAAGATQGSCTITAVANTTPGDGDVSATLTLDTPPAGADYMLGTPSEATVLVKNDDVAIPAVTLSCSPVDLVDAVDQVSTCTFTLDQAAPVGGLSLNITPLGVNDRYSTTCASPIAIAAGATTASCTLTATPNTVVGDGDVPVVLQLEAGTGYSAGAKAQETVTVYDDDHAVNPHNDDPPGPITAVPTLTQWALALLALVLSAFAASAIRRSRAQ